MGTRDAREDETIGEPIRNIGEGRKRRRTPRQLWEEMERQKAKRQGGSDEEPPTESAGPKQALEQEISVTPNTDDDEPREEMEAEAEESEEQLEESDDFEVENIGESELDEADEPEEEPAQEAEQEAPAAKPTPKMVEPDRQPGQMRYQYATHGPAPGEQEGEQAWPEQSPRSVSGGFVLGVIIIVAAVLIGLALVRQHKRISELEQRVTVIEQSVAPPE